MKENVMTKIKMLGAGLGLSALIVGCGSTRAQFPDSSQNKGKRVSASLSHFNILFLAPPSGLDQLTHDLSEQCNNGKVEGITVTDTRRFFYFFGEMISIEVVGHCAE